MARQRKGVSIARDKLLDELRVQKEKKLAEIDKQDADKKKKTETAAKAVVAAAAKDLTEEANLKALCRAVIKYESYTSDHGPHYREKWVVQYDQAIKLIELSSDETFEVAAYTNIGQLLGLTSYMY